MNFLKNLFTSKKEKSEKKKQLILSMTLFKDKQAYSLDQVVQELKTHWGLEISEVSGDDSSATFVIDGALVALALMDLPIPSQEFEELYAYSYLWQDVENETQEHTQHAIVSILIILGYFEPPVRVFGATVPEKGSHEFRCSRATFVPCL